MVSSAAAGRQQVRVLTHTSTQLLKLENTSKAQKPEEQVMRQWRDREQPGLLAKCLCFYILLSNTG
jgi:hypothetical protein